MPDLFLVLRKIADGIDHALAATSRAHGLLRGRCLEPDFIHPTRL